MSRSETIEVEALSILSKMRVQNGSPLPDCVDVHRREKSKMVLFRLVDLFHSGVHVRSIRLVLHKRIFRGESIGKPG